MFAAACGDDDSTQASDGNTSDTTSGDNIEQVATEVGDAAPSCTGDSDGVLKVGGLLPQTGSLAFLGPPEEAGANLAVSEINAAGGVLGQPIEYSPGDSGDTSTDIATQTVNRHLNEGSDMILGAASSAVSFTVIDAISGACKIEFSPANTSPDFTTYDDGDLYFRTAPADILQGRVMAELVAEDGYGSLALLALQDPYGEGLLKYTKQPFEEGGGDVVLDEFYDPQASNFSAEVDDVIAKDPDALVLIGFDESSKILTELFEKGFTPDKKGVYLVDGNIGNATGEDFASTPGALVGVKGTFPSAEVSQDFKNKLLGVDPALIDFIYGPETYDAVVITALAAEAAGTDDPAKIATKINGITRDGEKCTSFTQCRDLIKAGTTDIDYDGPSGPQTFSKAGEPTEASFAIQAYGADNKIDDSLTQYRAASL